MIGRLRFGYAMVLAVAAVWCARGNAQSASPQTTDGLERVDSPFSVLYWRPGETLESYRRVVLVDCYVEFRKDWLRDQNRGKRSFNLVTAEDMARIQETLSEEFLEVVTEVLEEDGAYEIVDVAANDVLLLRPAIVNVDVGADIYGSGNQLPDRSNGISMTLYLEFYDSVTGTLIGRAYDPSVRPEVDRAAARRILSRWARDVRVILDPNRNASD